MSPPAPPAPAAFHPTYPKLLHALLRAHGHDAHAALQEAGLSMERLQKDEAFVDAVQMQALIARTIALTARPDIGLEFGLLAQVFMHGPVGYAAVASATLRQAVSVLARFASLRIGAVRIELAVRQRDTDLVVVELLDMGPARVVMLEAIVTVLARLLQTLSGQPCADVEYFLPWPRPTWAAQYARGLAGVCHFDADRLVLRLPSTLLDSACLTADADAFAAAWQDCERKLGQQQAASPLCARLRARLQRCDGHYPTLAVLADEMALSTRSLMRKLKAEGSCYQDILDEVRCELARWHLLHTDASIEAIAERLGVQDTSNFSRSFRRWSGLSPSAFRASGRAAR